LPITKSLERAFIFASSKKKRRPFRVRSCVVESAALPVDPLVGRV
jgi:hypothetical protein